MGAFSSIATLGSAALERMAEIVDQLAGVPIPASVLERDVLPSRLPGYTPRLLDELGAMGEVAWVGRGALGRDDGRIALYRPGREIVRPQAPVDANDDATARPSGPRHDAIRAHLSLRGASFYRAIHAAAGGGSDREMLDALWDLVWAGEVTNDTFAPLRALRWKRPSGSGSGARRGRPGRLTALGPPEAAGRWSLVEPLEDTAPTERLHAQTLALLERHGVLTREAVAADGVNGGFSAVYPVLRALVQVYIDIDNIDYYRARQRLQSLLKDPDVSAKAQLTTSPNLQRYLQHKLAALVKKEAHAK